MIPVTMEEAVKALRSLATMKTFVGTKTLEGFPMTRGKYNNLRGWETPDNENTNDLGYVVIYEGDYLSWSPAKAFTAYRPLGMLTFGIAIEALKQGKKLARGGWNGKGMFIVLQEAYPNGIPINANTAKATGLPIGTNCSFRPYLMMKTADGSFVPWLASQSDVLCEDWMIVE